MKYILVALVSMLSFTATANSGWTGYGYVIELNPTIHHRFKVHLDVKANESSCREKQWFYQDYNASGAREMYLALLEAVVSNKTVRVYVTGRCDINEFAEISEVGIRP